MEQSGLLRRQKLVLILMALALVVVLVLLLSFVRQGTPASPLPTIAPSTRRPTTTATATYQAPATPGPGASVHASPTASRPAMPADVLVARRIEELVRDVGQIRDLPKQLEIPLNFLGDRETGVFLRRMLADPERRDFVRRQQALFAALDLSADPDHAFPPTVQTRVGHLIAFYDPVEAQVFVAPLGREGDSPDVSLVHQYAHALVDQHFDLLAFAGAPPNADAARARDALIEGDATAVMALHSFGGIDQADLDELADHLAEVELTDYEGYLISRAMRDVFLFPYREGTRFVAALLQAGWWPTVNTAYLTPPASTEQILHPEKYINTPRDDPRVLSLPDLSEDLDEGWQLVGQDVLGELILRAHLDQYLPDTSQAVAAAAGWDGDLAAVWHDLDGREVLVMRSVWDSRDEAVEFAGSYATVIGRRLRGTDIVMRPIVPRGGCWYRGERGNAYLQRTGDAVLVIWTPDTDTMEQVLSVFVFEEE